MAPTASSLDESEWEVEGLGGEVGGPDSYHSVQLGEISWLAARTFPVECAKLCLIDSEMWRPPKTCWVFILDVQPRRYEPVLNHLEINTITPPPPLKYIILMGHP